LGWVIDAVEEYVSFDVVDTDWTLYPVGTADNDFVGFFGYLPDEFVVGNNVSLLWVTPDNGDGSWSMYGWSNTEFKIVSDYLDDLTQTDKVLAVTGLDVFTGDDASVVSPKNMPHGIAEDDPSAYIVAATQDPDIASALIAIGAAGAPNLTEATNIQPVDDCTALNAGGYSQFDLDMAYKSRVVQEMMEVWVSDDILDSLEFTGLDADESVLRACFCFPFSWTTRGPWTPWVCTGGPTAGVSSCSYTGCTRNRPTFRHTLMPNCTVVTLRTANIWQGPQGVTIPILPGTACPPSP